MKKLFSILLVFLMLFSCAGCAENSTYDNYYDDEDDDEIYYEVLAHERAEFWDIWGTSGYPEPMSLGDTWVTDSFELKVSLDHGLKNNTALFELTTQRTYEECAEGDLLIEALAFGDFSEMLFYDDLYYSYSVLEFDADYDTAKQGSHSSASIGLSKRYDTILVTIITDGIVYKGAFI